MFKAMYRTNVKLHSVVMFNKHIRTSHFSLYRNHQLFSLESNDDECRGQDTDDEDSYENFTQYPTAQMDEIKDKLKKLIDGVRILKDFQHEQSKNFTSINEIVDVHTQKCKAIGDFLVLEGFVEIMMINEVIKKNLEVIGVNPSFRKGQESAWELLPVTDGKLYAFIDDII